MNSTKELVTHSRIRTLQRQQKSIYEAIVALRALHGDSEFSQDARKISRDLEALHKRASRRLAELANS